MLVFGIAALFAACVVFFGISAKIIWENYIQEIERIAEYEKIKEITDKLIKEQILKNDDIIDKIKRNPFYIKGSII